jgi:hypothetical protein
MLGAMMQWQGEVRGRNDKYDGSKKQSYAHRGRKLLLRASAAGPTQFVRSGDNHDKVKTRLASQSRDGFHHGAMSYCLGGSDLWIDSEHTALRLSVLEGCKWEVQERCSGGKLRRYDFPSLAAASGGLFCREGQKRTPQTLKATEAPGKQPRMVLRDGGFLLSDEMLLLIKVTSAAIEVHATMFPIIDMIDKDSFSRVRFVVPP